MSSIETDRSRTLLGSLFDQAIAPLAEARRAAGCQSYFPLTGDAKSASYYEEPSCRAMSAADFEFPGGGTPEGLIEALAQYWTSQGDVALAAMAPALKQIAESLRAEAAQSDGTVSPLCYAMF